MTNKEKLQKVSEEIMRFMRGRYLLDEVGDGKDELKFRRGCRHYGNGRIPRQSMKISCYCRKLSAASPCFLSLVVLVWCQKR